MTKGRNTIVAAWLLGAILWMPGALRAHEGMWLPTLLKVIEGDMRSEGLQLTAEDIYSVNNSSLKDAIVHFGGGCTAEVISTQGLILTNHHCGYGAIQRHSSLQHDYLRDGFMAATLADELPNEGLTATFIERMEDVTDRVLAGLPADADEATRNAKAREIGEAIAKEATKGEGVSAVVRPFNYGNSWFLIVSRNYRDVRLVCAPPGNIGKFGGDTDNWMWPRHTGDFSVFRIYAGADNAPAAYAKENVPYKPTRSLAISMAERKAGEFSMIYGFPGRTQRYLTSEAVDRVAHVIDPMRIRMRDASLGVIDAAMRANDLTRIQYANKQSSIANSWKKWIGEVRGLNELDAVKTKQTYEAEFNKRAAGHARYGQVLAELRALNAEALPYLKAQDNFAEFYAGGMEVVRFAAGFEQLVSQAADLEATGKWKGEVERLEASARGFFKNYDRTVDRDVFKVLLPLYLANNAPGAQPGSLAALAGRDKATTDAYVDGLFRTTIFSDSTKVYNWLRKVSPRSAAKMKKDPALVLGRELLDDYRARILPKATELQGSIDAAMRIYVEGQTKLFPEKAFWPDANSTLRLSYGRVEGSDPRDGVSYKPFTTLKGIMEKHKEGDPDFDVPAKLREVYARRDLAPYGRDEHMTVCFTSSLHTTGGNSGSPVLNGRGELIGLNFDRTWESTMSDILFDPAKCRNIAVDIRYVLFVIDKVCGGKRLVDEMELVRAEVPVMEPLPVR